MSDKHRTIIGIEEWKPIDGFCGYFVSSTGRIRSDRRKTPVIRKTEIDKDGYSRLTIRKSGANVHVVVSRIVCLAFNGAPKSDEFVCCHNDNNKQNNTASNLRWDTQKGNIEDKVDHGTHQIGSMHPRAEITEEDAASVKRAFLSYTRKRGKLLHAVKQTGISYNIVADISRGKTWRHVCI